MYSETLLLISLVLVILPVHNLCSARNIIKSCTSSCGNIPNISYPFRLKSDHKGCGLDNRYELACENNLTTLELLSVKYYVQAINYDNRTIHLKDGSVNKDNCSSIPLHFRFPLHFRPSDPYYVNINDEEAISLIFIKCANPVNDPLYVDTSTCSNGVGISDHSDSDSDSDSERGYSYVKIGPTNVLELVDSCHIELMTITSDLLLKELHNVSYFNIHDSMAYGFEISWHVQSEFYCINVGPQCLPRPGTTLLNYLSDVLGYVDALLFRLLSALNFVPRYHSYVLDQAVYPVIFRRVPVWMKYPYVLLYYLSVLFGLFHLALFICGAPCCFAFLIYKWRRRHLSMYNGIEEFLQSQANFMPVRYSYSDIKRVTNGFKNKLGEGGFGHVYKGTLRSGRLAAIKMLDKSKANGKDFISEVGTIGKIHHVNVVQLLGFCVEGSHRALVYEFMPNGSLDKFIFSQQDSKVLSNEKMHEISLGVARGIEYLHRGCDMQILHFDIKPHNILLDENFIPKISDFGLAKLYPTNYNTVSLTAARGTMGYMAPELCFMNIGGVSYKADVYSFGMLLMEMAGRRKNLHAFAEHSSQTYFPSLAYHYINEGKEIEIGDATEDERSTTKKMIMVALWCIQLRPTDRPAMHKVREMLQRDVKDIEMPPEPSLSLLDECDYVESMGSVLDTDKLSMN